MRREGSAGEVGEAVTGAAPAPCAAAGRSEPLLVAIGLVKRFRVPLGPFRRESVTAVDGVSLSLSAGETLALVGESGSGKTTTARMILRLVDSDEGTVRLGGVDWLALPPRELNRERRHVGVVFQDPATSLDPRMDVGEIVGEPLAIHRLGTPAERRRQVAELLDAVGLPASAAGRRPSEFSGGQRQRIGIARALATRPRLVVLDEPVSALDVSVRAQVLNLLLDLQAALDPCPAYLFISHDLGVVRHFADRTAVMQGGRIVEEGATTELFGAPRDPYTRLLLDSEPGRPRAARA